MALDGYILDEIGVAGKVLIKDEKVEMLQVGAGKSCKIRTLKGKVPVERQNLANEE